MSAAVELEATLDTATRIIGLCDEGVTRHDEFQPCDKPAVAVRRDPEGGGTYPVCKRHVRGDMVPLVAIVAAARAKAVPA